MKCWKTSSLSYFSRRLLGTLGMVAFFLLGTPALSRAASVVPLTVEEMSAVADDIVYGVVETSQSELVDGKIITRHSLKVRDSLKGTHKSDQDLEVMTLGGRVGPIASISPGMPELEKDEEVVLFLSTPAKRHAKEKGVAIDTSSPLTNLPQIVGGFQGKFNVVRLDVEHDADVKKFTTESVRVVRSTPGKSLKVGDAPSLNQFLGSVRNLNNSARPMRKDTKNIPTIGKVQVPAYDESAQALRYFDPIPIHGRQVELGEASSLGTVSKITLKMPKDDENGKAKDDNSQP